MGKYDKFICKASDNQTDFFLKMIANELAEANRLKRIEIQMMEATSPTTETGQKIAANLLMELEDQS